MPVRVKNIAQIFVNWIFYNSKTFFFFCYHSFYFFALFYLALSPTFTVSAGELAEASPYNCYLECLKQNIIQKDKPLTIGLAQGTICLCGHDPSKYFLFLCQHIVTSDSQKRLPIAVVFFEDFSPKKWLKKCKITFPFLFEKQYFFFFFFIKIKPPA